MWFLSAKGAEGLLPPLLPSPPVAWAFHESPRMRRETTRGMLAPVVVTYRHVARRASGARYPHP
jgi:hypothetical protein